MRNNALQLENENAQAEQREMLAATSSASISFSSSSSSGSTGFSSFSGFSSVNGQSVQFSFDSSTQTAPTVIGDTSAFNFNFGNTGGGFFFRIGNRF